ncbi:MAG TPA: hypothetical protein VNC50_04605, partial [Planctomycetia bacterium]|nr:hypothetical protein [Planctomycetia bacterium]
MPVWRWVLWELLALAACGAHATAVTVWCGGAKALHDPYPFLSDDHPLHFYNSQATRHFLDHSKTNAGYDPYFMAGYAKSSLWPTHPQLEGMIWLLQRREQSAAADGSAAPAQPPPRGYGGPFLYKLYVLIAAAFPPVALLLAGRAFGATVAVRAIAAWLWVLLFWYGKPFQTYTFVQWGMSAFLSSVSWTFLAAGLAQRWIREQTWSSMWLAAVAGALALMAHPTVLFVITPPLLVYWAMSGAWSSFAANRQGMTLLAAIAIVNGWWILPIVTQWDTYAPGPGFFQNPNVGERIADLFRADSAYADEYSAKIWTPPTYGVLLAAAMVAGWRLSPVLPMGILWLAILSIFAGKAPQLGFLQPGRNTMHLQMWIALGGAMAFAGWIKHKELWVRGAAAAAIAWMVAGMLPRIKGSLDTVADSASGKQAGVLNGFDPKLKRLVESLHQVLEADPGARRVMFESCETGGPTGGLSGVYGATRLAPLMPLLCPGTEFIGGPYLKTHYKDNYAQVGDGELFGLRAWDRRRFLAHCELYAVDCFIPWSPEALVFCEKNSELFAEVGGIAGAPILKIKRQAAAWEQAGLVIEADYDKIDVGNPRGAKGAYLLPYHWHAGWKVSGGATIAPKIAGEDPVPFIEITFPAEANPPAEKIELRFTPWKIPPLSRPRAPASDGKN